MPLNNAFKTLDSSDINLLEHNLNVSWTFSSSADMQANGICITKAISGSTVEEPINPYISTSSLYCPGLAYRELQQCFYTGSLTNILSQNPFAEDTEFSGSSFNVEDQSTITVYGSRVLANSNTVISIPRKYLGNYIVEQSIELGSEGGTYVDREGVLVDSATQELVGDVIYTKGLIILTKSVGEISSLKFSSQNTINTYYVNCKVQDIEYNYTYNKTAQESLQSSGKFTPYITSIGLYNNAHELLAIAKLAKPLKKSSDITTTFKVQIDI